MVATPAHLLRSAAALGNDERLILFNPFPDEAVVRVTDAGGKTSHTAIIARHLETIDPPVVAAGPNAANPHYEPEASRPRPIARGDANKVWVVPSELNDALKGLGSVVGSVALWSQRASLSGPVALAATAGRTAHWAAMSTASNGNGTPAGTSLVKDMSSGTGSTR